MVFYTQKQELTPDPMYSLIVLLSLFPVIVL